MAVKMVVVMDVLWARKRAVLSAVLMVDLLVYLAWMLVVV